LSSFEPKGKIEILEPNKEAQPPETIKISFPISIQKVFDIFFSDEAKFSLVDLMKTRGI